MHPLIVIGSINQDSFAFVANLPAPGETVLAHSASVGLGGKGCNQAMAASLAGAKVAFIGAVGADAAGTFALDSLAAAGVEISGIERRNDVGTGAAYITVDDAGENSIVVASGANALVTGDAACAVLAHSTDAPTLLVQGELPAEVVGSVAAYAREHDLRLVMNLAPVSVRNAATIAVANPLIVNETEAADLLGQDCVHPAEELREAYGVDVVVTVGAQGALVASAEGSWRQPSPVPTAVVDTTGAGDAFVGVLTAGLCAGLTLRTAVTRAAAAASHSVSGRGTVTSYATKEQIDELVG